MFDFTLQCEIQTATGRLPDLVWSQGTTPLILAVPTRKGARIGADSGTVARMMIAPTPTSETWAVVESTGTAEGGYLLQWPTVGAHTEKDKPWFYTVYFMRDGHRYWTGSGLLWIEETTATGDGLVWQEIATWEDMVDEVVAAVQDKNLSRLTLNGETITEWPSPGGSGVSSVNGLTGPVTLAPGENVDITPNGNTLRFSVTGGGGAAEQGRIVTAASYTLAAGDTLIIMDSVTAGANQTLTLPNLAADFATITVRQLGDAYYTTIAHGQNSILLSGDGSWVCIDWVKSKSAWYWRN